MTDTPIREPHAPYGELLGWLATAAALAGLVRVEPALPTVVVLAAFATLIGWFSWKTKSLAPASWLVVLRVPLVGALALLILPALVGLGHGGMLGNLLVTRRAVDTAAILGLAWLAGTTTIRVGSAILYQAPIWLGGDLPDARPLRPGTTQRRLFPDPLRTVALGLVLAAPLASLALKELEFPLETAFDRHALALFLGLGSGGVVSWVLAGGLLPRPKLPPQRFQSFRKGGTALDLRAAWALHLGLSISALGFVGVYVALGVTGGLAVDPTVDGRADLLLPSPAYLLVLHAGAMLLLGALAFFLDRWRLPLTVAALVILTAFGLVLRARGPRFDVFPEARATPVLNHPAVLRPGAGPDAATSPMTTLDRERCETDLLGAAWCDQRDHNVAAARAALCNRLERIGAEDEDGSVILLASAGGGIQAATWSTMVVGGLDALLPAAAFRDRVVLLTGASGGAVGNLHLLDRLFHPDAVGDDPFEALEAARDPSLAHVTWGMVYGDPWLSGWGRWSMDRGWALEAALDQRLLHLRGEDGRAVGLHALQGATWRGELPITSFEAMFVESGRKLVLSPLPLSPRPGERADTQLEVWPGHDLRASTAARLSASFPLASPFARSAVFPTERSEERISDGGFFDNYGLSTAVSWIDRVLVAPPVAAEADCGFLTGGRRHVELIAIDAFQEVDTSWIAIQARQLVGESRQDPPSALPGWAETLEGPLTALNAARQVTQRAHFETELRQLAQLAANEQVELEVRSLRFALPGEVEEYVEPLTWQLAEEEVRHLCVAWREQLSMLHEALVSAPVRGDRPTTPRTRLRRRCEAVSCRDGTGSCTPDLALACIVDDLAPERVWTQELRGALEGATPGVCRDLGEAFVVPEIPGDRRALLQAERTARRLTLGLPVDPLTEAEVEALDALLESANVNTTGIPWRRALEAVPEPDAAAREPSRRRAASAKPVAAEPVPMDTDTIDEALIGEEDPRSVTVGF